MYDIPRNHRSALPKFRCGVAPIRLETGRYERLDVPDRTCTVCGTVETECHVVCECPLYQDLRNNLFNNAKSVISNFDNLGSEEKLCAIFSNSEIVKVSAKILCDILARKRSLTYN